MIIFRRFSLCLIFALCGVVAVAVGAQTVEEWCAENGKEFPLHCAAGRGDVAEIKRLAEAGSDVNRANEEGFTPLHWAANSGYTQVIIVLAEVGADVNRASKNGSTPLHWAALRGHAKVIIALAEAGADVNRAKKEGFTPLHFAAVNGHAKAIVALAEAGADVNRGGKRWQYSVACGDKVRTRKGDNCSCRSRGRCQSGK